MMTQKERLVELLRLEYGSDTWLCSTECGVFSSHTRITDIETVADYLLKNGVIVPPCKVGDTVWFIRRDSKWQGILDSGVVENLSIRLYDGIFNGMGDVGINIKKQPNEGDNYYHVFFNNVFKSKKEAEQALKEKTQ